MAALSDRILVGPSAAPATALYCHHAIASPAGSGIHHLLLPPTTTAASGCGDRPHFHFGRRLPALAAATAAAPVRCGKGATAPLRSSTLWLAAPAGARPISWRRFPSRKSAAATDLPALWQLTSSAVLPTCLFGYFRVFREPHRMVLPGNVRFQAGDGLLTDWCSPDFDCIDHSVAKSMGKRCVRPSPSGVGYFPSNSG